MDTAQHVFYIIGSIALGLLAIALLVIMGVALYVQSKISRMERRMRYVGYELRELLRSGKSYGKYLGASLGFGVIGRLLRFLRD